MNKLIGEQVLMRIFLGERDRHGHRPLYEALVELLRSEGLAGATVLRGIAGFGAHSVYHTQKLLDLSADLPLVIEVVDSQAKIDAVMPRIDGMMQGGMITLEKATVQAACDLAHSLGARTIVSSVHLHVTFAAADKASGAVRFLSRKLGMDPTLARSRAAFIGDSENDEACFGAFMTTLTVKNFRGRPTVSPRYVTRGERGAGFAEAAGVLLERRRRGSP